jgi:hypothetical protein
MATEDLYDVEGLRWIIDWGNEVVWIPLVIYTQTKRKFAAARLRDIRSVVGAHGPIQSPEERFLHSGGHYYHPEIMEDVRRELNRHPEKIKRLNLCIRVVNECKTLTSFRMALNEITRLLHGKEKAKEKNLWSPGERYDPDRLKF